jgi:hypothetical protein|nr:MAG TPA: hypothetical protein [Caudoviricetes sp.]
MELKNYNIEATGSLYCSENFTTIRVDGQTYDIEKLIYEMMKSLKNEENLGIETCGTLNITFTREPEKLTVNGIVKKEEKA